MQNVGNELRNIAITKVAQAYLCHTAKSNIINLSDSMPASPMLLDLWVMLLTQKIYIREGARDLNIRLDGDMQVNVKHFHHTRRHGLLTAYESALFSNKIETILLHEIYAEIGCKSKNSAGKIIDAWTDRLELDPSWSEKTIRTYRNRKHSNYPFIHQPFPA